MKLLALMVLLAVPLAAQPVIELRELPGGTTVASTGNIALGNQYQRDVQKNIWIVNTGDADLTVDSVTTYNENSCTVMPVLGFPKTIAPGGYTAATLRITITAIGAFDLDVEVLSDDPLLPNYNIGLFGTGVSAPDLRVLFAQGGVTNGGTQNIGSTWDAAGPNQFGLTVYNWGIAGSPDLGWGPGTVLSILSTTNCSLGLAPDPTTPLPVGNWIPLYNSLNIMAPGPFSFTLRIVTNDPDESPWIATFNGVGVTEPILQVSNATGGQLAHDSYVVLGALPVGVGTSYGGSVRNAGVGILTLTATPVIQLTNMVNCTVNLVMTPLTNYSAGANAPWSIMIFPTAAGPFSFDLEIPNNSPGTPLYVAHFVDTAPVPPPPGGGGGGGGGGGDDEACSTGHGKGPWLALIAALAACTLALRSRAARQ